MRFALGFLALLMVVPEALARDIRVVTYNVWGLPGPLMSRPSRMKDLVAEIPKLDADIIAFQETFNPKTHVLSKLPAYPYRAWGDPGGDGGKPFSDGLLIVSRWPIVDSATISYSRCSGTDCFAQKGALHARIQVMGQEIDVFTTHMNAGIKGNEDIRISQIRELFNFVISRSGNRPILLVGDFNSMPGSDSYREISSLLHLRDGHAEFVANATSLDPIQKNGYTMDTYRNSNMWFAKPFAKPMRIDYVWLGGYGVRELAVEDSRLVFDWKVKKKHLSDHFGVQMDLNYR